MVKSQTESEDEGKKVASVKKTRKKRGIQNGHGDSLYRKPRPKQCKGCKKILRSQFNRHKSKCKKFVRAGFPWIILDQSLNALPKAEQIRLSKQKYKHGDEWVEHLETERKKNIGEKEKAKEKQKALNTKRFLGGQACMKKILYGNIENVSRRERQMGCIWLFRRLKSVGTQKKEMINWLKQAEQFNWRENKEN